MINHDGSNQEIDGYTERKNICSIYSVSGIYIKYAER